jgi:bacterioferritin-associated ferredoxin
MFVCLCKGVTERAVWGAIRSGARTVEDIGGACGAGTGCGSCHDLLACALRCALGPPGHGDACPGMLEPSISLALAGAIPMHEGEAP